MPLIILSILVKLVLIVHITKTGRNSAWIWIVLIVPVIGPLAYFIVEIWPELNGGRTARGAKRAVGQAINPTKSLREAASNYEYVDTVENFPGPESTYRHAMLLKELGEMKESKNLIEGIIHTAKISSLHYRSINKIWIKMAKTELSSGKQPGARN